KIPLLEESVNCVGNQGSDAEYGLEGIRPRSQMRNCSEIFQSMPLLPQRIIRCGHSLHLNMIGLNLKGLSGLRRCHKLSLNNQRSSYITPGNLREIIKPVSVYDLKRFKKGS